MSFGIATSRHDVGGDYYGFIPLFAPDDDRREPPRQWAVAVGDVVGKGLPAALLTAKLSAEIRLFLQGETDPARVLARLNHQLSENGVLDMYITFLLVIFDVLSNRLQVANAGHPYPLIRRRDGSIEDFGKAASGFPLAIEDNCTYESTETTLAPGETVILFTDGVTDALNPAGDRFGEARLRPLLAEGPAAPARWAKR